jgi:uncharacterized membrane protein
MNTTDNNIVLMFLLFLIPIYVIFVCFFNQKFPERFYPIVIFSIGISILLLMALRYNHLIGTDSHLEYFFYHSTLNNLHWSIYVHAGLDACLSISLLPTIYQSILNIRPEFLFKIIHAILFSISPLATYIIFKRYIGDFYAFLGSFFLIAQQGFIITPMLARTNTAVLFTILAFMVLFHEDISEFNKKILFIIFGVSCIISHYSTTYIFFFILLLTWIGIQIIQNLLTRRVKTENTSGDTIIRAASTHKKGITISLVILFFTVIFFWYSQVTVVAFNSGVFFISKTFLQLNDLFLLESRGGQMMQAVGKEGIVSITQKIKWVVYWLMVIYICIGVLYSTVKYKKIVSFLELDGDKADFLKSKMEIDFFIISLVCFSILAFSVLTPFVFQGYDMSRIFFQMAPLLSIFFVIGGITVAKILKLRHYTVTIILIILIPMFLCSTSCVDVLFNAQTTAFTLSSESFHHDYNCIYDQDTHAGRWLKDNGNLGNERIFTDVAGRKLISQGGIQWGLINNEMIFVNDTRINGYIYLRHYNVINGKLLDGAYVDRNITEFQDKFIGKGKIYNSGSEVWG